MHQIEFRAWSKKARKWLDVPFYISADGKKLRAEFPVNGDPNVESVTGVYDLSEFEVVRYTGRKDKSGRKIYEGDVVSILNTEGPNRGEESTYAVRWGSTGWPLLIALNGNEVVGNIYENPELLENAA